MFNFDDLISAVEGDDFDERPVTLKEFVTSKEYLGEPTPSEIQYELIEASTQIYYLPTLIKLHGAEEGKRRWKNTVNEVIANWGKGSGKDWSSEVSCAYIVYQLMCLREPAKYYGKPDGDFIDIINIAINATQASNVFFAGFSRMIERSPWFSGKYTKKAGEFEFDKSIRVISGHSEREAYEGYNFIVAVLDEISGFAMDSGSGNENAKTADAIYKMYSASVTSRFDDIGKIILLSFSRYKGDFISTRYEAVIAEKEVIRRTHTFKLDDELDDGIEENEFSIDWDEDHIIRYKQPAVYAIRRPTWDVHPDKTINSFKRAFFNDPLDSIGRYASQPPEAIEGFFRDHDKVDAALDRDNGMLEDWTFSPALRPIEDKQYFIHVDLAQKHDNCVVSMAHVAGWKTYDFGGGLTEPVPEVIVDSIRVWTPTKDKTVDFTEVREHIVALRSRGFNIVRVTFDRWNSTDMINYLNNIGLRAELLSVALKHYTDLKMLISEGRVHIPRISLLATELKQLKIMPNGKIDHPRTGSKDIADSVCGAVFNAIDLTDPEFGEEVEIVTAEDLIAGNVKKPNTNWPISAPKANAPPPDDVADFLARMRTI